MRSIHQLKILGFVLLTVLIFMANLFSYREQIASYVWQKTHLEASWYIDPWNSALAYSIGNYYFNHGTYDPEKAERYFRHATIVTPLHLDAHYQLGRILFIKGKFIEAKHEIDTVIAANPDFEKAYYMRGLILGYQGRLEQGIPYFEEFIRRAPNEWAGYNDLAWLYFRMGEYEKVRETTEKGLGVSPENVWLLNMHGLALHNLGRSEEAQLLFKRAKERADILKPEDWGKAYPGNDPAIYADGLARMHEAIDHNLKLVE